MIQAETGIIGFGPAGMACAVQLRRMGHDPLVIERNEKPGLLRNAGNIENYLGFPGGISGKELYERFLLHARNFDLKIVSDTVTKADFTGDVFHLKGLASEYSIKNLVIATGTRPVPFPLLTGEVSSSRMIHYDLSSLNQESGKLMAIIGAGDAAFDYALSLAKQGNQVCIFNRSDRVKALTLLVERAFAESGISYLPGHEVTEISLAEDNKVRILFKNGQAVKADHIIFATGRVPDADFLSAELQKQKETLVKEHRLYFIGDVINGRFRQLSIATGDGIRAAMEIGYYGSI
jgi:thioredoxin reductase